jgi:hypothetical protein
MIVAYNSRENGSSGEFAGTICPEYSPLDVVDDDAILDMGSVGLSVESADFLDQEANVKAFEAGAA